MKKSLKKGFTLVELVIVIAVIAILSAVLIPTFGNVIQNSKDTAAYENAKNAMTSYAVNNDGASVGDGWVVVFSATNDYKTGAVTLTGSDYVFQYKDGALIQKHNKDVLKGNNEKFKNAFSISELTITADTWTSKEGTTVTAVPLNYKFTTTTDSSSSTPYSLTATVWWFSANITL